MRSHFYLLSTLFLALCAHSLVIQLPTSLVEPPSQTASNITSQLALTPWPRPPFEFLVSKKFSFVSLKIKEYGSPGPAVLEAGPLLATLARQIAAGGSEYDLVENHVEAAPGVMARFTKTGRGYGLTRLQASHLFVRLSGLTRLHGAVGVEFGEIESYGISRWQKL